MVSPVHVLMLSIQTMHAWSSSPACVHLALFLALSLSPDNSLVSSWRDHSMLVFALTVFNSSFLTPALLRTHSFVLFVVHETHSVFLRPFISKASKCHSLLGPFYGAIAVPSVTRCLCCRCCRCCCGHRCAGGVRQ